ncbi:MAG TPA: hypothetical protein VGG10_18045 [Rhizomicrobium sp.]|jgi:hypothetical protein
MRTTLAALAASAVLFGCAYAADTAAQSGPANTAVNTDGGNNSTTPVAGANSFTMSEAKSRIESRGYTKVHGLKKDASGVWRGHAMKDGASVAVSVDYQGNVN